MSRLIYQERFVRPGEQYRKSPFEYEETAPIEQKVLVLGHVFTVGSSQGVNSWLERRQPDVNIRIPSAPC